MKAGESETTSWLTVDYKRQIGFSLVDGRPRLPEYLALSVKLGRFFGVEVIWDEEVRVEVDLRICCLRTISTAWRLGRLTQICSQGSSRSRHAPRQDLPSITMSRPNPVVRTDAPVRTALPSAQLTRPTTTTEPDSFTYLKNTEEQFNVVIDKEVETLVNGMKEIVRLADLGTGHPGDGEGEGSVGGLESVKDKFKVKEEGFEMELRAESMVSESYSRKNVSSRCPF